MKTLFEAPNAHEPHQAWCVYSHFDADSDVQDYVIETSVDSGRDPLEAINMLSDLVGMKNNLKRLVA
jgi:hypothetical protein